tara:strand:+ start:91 stop:699 length:609 start_codon:yes stop_codon:yes gene_type:complete
MNIVIEVKMLKIRLIMPVIMVVLFGVCATFVRPLRAKTDLVSTEDTYKLAGRYIITPQLPEAKGGVQDDAPIILSEDEKDLITRTVWGEARSQSFEGKIAIAEVILKRIRDAGGKVSEVVKAKKQFSCWNQKDPNRRKMLKLEKTDAHYKTAREALEKALEGTSPISQGADHYHARYVKPKWARGQKPVVTIGAHHFYNIRA